VNGLATTLLAITLLVVMVFAVVWLGGEIRLGLARLDVQLATKQAEREAARTAGIEAEVDLTHAETTGVVVRHGVYRADATLGTLLLLGCAIVGGLTALCVTLLRRMAHLERRLTRQLAPPYVAASLTPPADTWLPVGLRQQVEARCERG